MQKRKINLIGGGFQHSLSTSGHEPIYIEWIKNQYISNLSFYIDHSIKNETNPNTINYAWLCESKTIIPDLYNWCESNIKFLKTKFKYIFTHDVELSKKSNIFKLTQCSGKSFLKNGEIFQKSKLVSIIASNKTFCAEHLYRKEIIKKFNNQCDHFGRGYKELINKEDGLKDYCFSFVLENATYPNMFTEKITDCFMCGTIPIYYGINNIGDFFDENGIIRLDDNFKIENLSFDLYYSKLNSIKKNLIISKQMLTAEDFIYLNFLKNEN